MAKRKRKSLKQTLKEFGASAVVPGGGVDSIWSRLSSKKTDSQHGGAATKQKLGIEDEPHQDITAKSPLKMMDIVMQTWGDQLPGDPQQDPVAASYANDDEDDEGEYQDKDFDDEFNEDDFEEEE